MRIRLAAILFACAFVIVHPHPAEAQLQQGAIRGTVVAPDGQPASSAVVILLDPLGVELARVPVTRGAFTISNVPLGTYAIRAEAPPLQGTVQQVSLTSAIALRVEIRLSAVASEQVVVHGEESDIVTTTRVTLGGDAVRRAPARLRSRGLQGAIATAPGWATEDNGLLHVRGVDDGFLYVIDGVPVYERLDGLFGMAPDPSMVDSLNIVTGYIPPEFGWKAGGVLEVRSAARTSEHWAGTTDVQLAADDTRELSAVAGGPLGAATALTAGITRQSSSRFLDPVHPENLHNDGSAWTAGAQLGWSVSPTNTITAVASAGRSDFDVPHGEEQEEAGQDQQQRVRQYAQSLSWQRVWSSGTVSQVAQYVRRGSAAVDGSASDTPLFVHTDRSLDRAGLLASVSHQRGRHLFKAGGEMSFLRLREDFLFAVTDAQEAGDADLSDAVLAFTRDDPFHFQGSASPSLFSIYAQDSIRVSDRLTVDAGVRVDWSRLLARRTQVSPRLGAAYFVPRTGTTLRSSVGRFFQPPQPENVLLSSSDEAWQLSPFRDETGGGAPLEPERQTAFEVGVNQPLTGAIRLDVAYWHRRMKHVSDPNVFFGTTVIFPNSVARGRASGLEVRMELPRHRGWSGYVSYANSRVVQFGPISGGLFLEEEVIEIGPGTAFTPDHDQRHVGAFGLTFDAGSGAFWAAFTGRHESGTPLEVDEDEIDELRDRPGAEMVDFDRGRVKPRTLFDVSASKRLLRRAGVDLSLRAAVLNLTGTRRAYNFGNPFSGTHFGPGRTAQVGVRVAFR